MQTLPRTFETRRGSTAILRRMKTEDADDLLNTDRAVVEADAGVVRVPSDVTTDAEEVRSRIKSYVDGGPYTGDGGLGLVVETNGVAMGEAEIHRYRQTKLRHVASLSIQVHPHAQGAGVGRALMESILEWALSPDRQAAAIPLHRLELMVRADNNRARSLYKSFGFEVEATRRNFLREPDGHMSDDLIMVRFI